MWENTDSREASKKEKDLQIGLNGEEQLILNILSHLPDEYNVVSSVWKFEKWDFTIYKNDETVLHVELKTREQKKIYDTFVLNKCKIECYDEFNDVSNNLLIEYHKSENYNINEKKKALVIWTFGSSIFSFKYDKDKIIDYSPSKILFGSTIIEVKKAECDKSFDELINNIIELLK